MPLRQDMYHYKLLQEHVLKVASIASTSQFRTSAMSYMSELWHPMVLGERDTETASSL